MKKAKRNFNTNKAISMLKYDFSHKGFALDHDEKLIYVLASTDSAIRNGNEALLDKFIELTKMYPNYKGSVLHIMFIH